MLNDLVATPDTDIRETVREIFRGPAVRSEIRMTDIDCVEFLQWAMPRLQLRWTGFRRVRRQVRKRLARRLAELELPDLDAYRTRLETDTAEWEHLDALCRITVSRLYRNRRVWDFVGSSLLPELEALAHRRGDDELRCWSAGCASGEEAYTLAMVWRGRPTPADRLPLHILATDADADLLERARRAVYGPSSVRDLPEGLHQFLTVDGDRYHVDPVCRAAVTFECRDIRGKPPDGMFHLVLCRNLAFTYFDESVQLQVSTMLAQRLIPGGALIVGAHESLPASPGTWSAQQAPPGIYRIKKSIR